MVVRSVCHRLELANPRGYLHHAAVGGKTRNPRFFLHSRETNTEGPEPQHACFLLVAQCVHARGAVEGDDEHRDPFMAIDVEHGQVAVDETRRAQPGFGAGRVKGAPNAAGVEYVATVRAGENEVVVVGEGELTLRAEGLEGRRTTWNYHVFGIVENEVLAHSAGLDFPAREEGREELRRLLLVSALAGIALAAHVALDNLLALRTAVIVCVLLRVLRVINRHGHNARISALSPLHRVLTTLYVPF